MKKTFLTLVLLGAGFVLAAQDAFAQQQRRNCGDRTVVVERLAEGYGETRQSIGLGANNVVFEVFASNETGTWTITMTMPNGVTCLMASGVAFEENTDPLLPTAGEEI